MKNFLSASVSVGVLLVSSFALADSSINPAETSAKLVGTWRLDTAAQNSGDCSATLEVKADENGVYTDRNTFYANENGCETVEGDIGPWRHRCGTFSDREVSYSDTQPVSAIGYVSEYKGLHLALFESDVLIYENTTTLVPFGFLRSLHEEDFHCTYQRVKN